MYVSSALQSETLILTNDAKKGRKNMLMQSRMSRSGDLGEDGGVGDDRLLSSCVS